MSPALCPADREHLLQHLGTDLHDVVAIAARDAAGRPQVVRIRPLRRVGDTFEPCPTHLWLTDPELHAAISRLEAAGAVRDLEARLAADETARATYHAQHEAYAADRLAGLDEDHRKRAEELDYLAPLRDLGIGGLRNRDAVKCLHLHVAHHLVAENIVGRWTLEALPGAERS